MATQPGSWPNRSAPGWAKGLLRDPLPVYGDATRELAEQVGAGETSYSHYDQRICATACDWLQQIGAESDKPWVLFVSFVSPHYPLMCSSSPSSARTIR
jgi:choline-sulfatase